MREHGWWIMVGLILLALCVDHGLTNIANAIIKYAEKEDL